MSPYRHLIVCAILLFVLFYGFANLVKAEPISADCDYEHVVLLFGAKAYDYYAPPVEPTESWDVGGYVLRPIKNSTSGLPYDRQYNLFINGRSRLSTYARADGAEVIDMRDVARAIQNYQKSQST